MPRGFSLPLSPLGIANLAPLPPWHYVGDMLVVAYEADPGAVAAVLPPRFFESPAHELHALAPVAVGRGYHYTMALTIDDQIELRDLRAEQGGRQ